MSCRTLPPAPKKKNHRGADLSAPPGSRPEVRHPGRRAARAVTLPKHLEGQTSQHPQGRGHKTHLPACSPIEGRTSQHPQGRGHKTHLPAAEITRTGVRGDRFQTLILLGDIDCESLDRGSCGCLWLLVFLVPCAQHAPGLFGPLAQTLFRSSLKLV